MSSMSFQERQQQSEIYTNENGIHTMSIGVGRDTTSASTGKLLLNKPNPTDDCVSDRYPSTIRNDHRCCRNTREIYSTIRSMAKGCSFGRMVDCIREHSTLIGGTDLELSKQPTAVNFKYDSCLRVKGSIDRDCRRASIGTTNVLVLVSSPTNLQTQLMWACGFVRISSVFSIRIRIYSWIFKSPTRSRLIKPP